MTPPPPAGTKRAIGVIEFSGAVEVFPGVHAHRCVAGEKLRTANTMVDCPVMYYDSATDKIVVDDWVYPASGGLVKRWKFAAAVKTKVAP